jgi:hypothetical protein
MKLLATTSDDGHRARAGVSHSCARSGGGIRISPMTSDPASSASGLAHN